jgi:hypothetical protein
MSLVGTGVQNGSGSGGFARRAQNRPEPEGGQGFTTKLSESECAEMACIINTCSYSKLRTNSMNCGIKQRCGGITAEGHSAAFGRNQNAEGNHKVHKGHEEGSSHG